MARQDLAELGIKDAEKEAEQQSKAEPVESKRQKGFIAGVR